MARPKKPIPSYDLHVKLPLPLALEVMFRNISEQDQRMPHGTWQRYLTNLIEADLLQPTKPKRTTK